MASSNSTGKLYFGYGSNLSIPQMHSRCPNSHYVGLARLKGWKWIINDRGYANVVELSRGSSASKANEVWGLVFYLTESDEQRLDRNEGVPYAYTKEMPRVDFWRHALEDLDDRIDVEAEKSTRKEVLVYVDRKRTTDSKPKEEYIIRMNNGIEDAVRFGMPHQYVNDVMRKFIPEPDGEEDEGMVAKAAKQALMFRDEDEPELDGYRDR